MNKNDSTELSENQHLDLGSKVLFAFRWLAAGKFLGQLINWAITLVVIRLLTPADYGLMAMASLFISILTLFNEMGLGAAIIQSEHIEQQVLKQVFGVIICINGALFLLLFLASPLIALFFQEKLLTPIVRLLAIEFVFIAFSVVPQSLLEREMHFKERSIIDFVSNLLAGFTTLGLALLGKGVWSLVWGGIILFLSKMIGLNLFAPFFHWPIFSFKGMRRFISFGSFIMLERVIWYLYSQADVFIIGRILGKELLGFYSVGKHVARLPSLKIMPIVNQVVLPAFSRIQKDLGQIAYYIQKGIRILSFFAYPIFLGISSIAPELVASILGEKWLLASKTLMWVTLVLPLGMSNGIVQTALKSVGKPNVSLKNISIGFVIMPIAFLVGCRWGILGVSLAWVIVYPFYSLLAIYFSTPFLGLHMSDIFKAMSKPGVSGVVMYVVVLIIKNFIRGSVPQILELILLISTGAVIYIGVQFYLDRKSFQEVIRLIKK